jgi:CelD/BcsL family acetyltransferase involved in cellulose biosynthesis
LVGASIPPRVLDPPVAGQWADNCFGRIADQLFGPDRCDLISFGPLSETCEPWQQLPQALAGTRAGVRVELDRSDVHTVFRLPESHAVYLDSLNRNEQKQRRKYELRTLKKQHDVTVDVVAGPPAALLDEFDAFAPMHAKQWEIEGKAGHFGSWPRGLPFNRALVEALGSLDRVRFIRITAGGTTVSSQYVFCFAGRWYWELPARLSGSDWDRFSLGPSGIVTMIGEAIARGVCWIQGGIGHYDYKLRLGAVEHAVWRFRVTRPGRGTAIRAWAFERLRDMLRAGYHKVWYRRVQPRLPVRLRRAQWWLWLRWDV